MSLDLPPGRKVDLPGRGRTFVRELPGPPGASTLLLLHGWTVTSDLTWFACYRALGEHYRVVAIDHRGHGRGIRSRKPFRLADCADDAAALCEVLGIESAIPVGYSMGGTVAQLLWRRHRQLVDGLVLCATSRTFATRSREKTRFALLAGAAVASRAVPAAAGRALADRVLGTREALDPRFQDWLADELRRSNWTAVLEAGAALGRFDSRRWIGQVDVPTAVVIPTRDEIINPRRQLAMAEAIPGATVHPVSGDHKVCVTDPRAFLTVLLEACASVSPDATMGRPKAAHRVDLGRSD